MHAYRDAIRRSAGAYVLYPGSGPDSLEQELHEILPGIGAFPLRPSSGGRADGTAALARFIHDVLVHVADQSTARERTQFWSWQRQEQRGAGVLPAEGAPRPPADLSVLVGYVREGQDTWVHDNARYNVRAGDRRGAVPLDSDLLDADVVLLWSDRGEGAKPRVRSIWVRKGPWVLADASELIAAGYPDRPSEYRYLVTGLTPIERPDTWAVDDEALASIAAGDKRPTLARWIDLAARTR